MKTKLDISKTINLRSVLMTLLVGLVCVSLFFSISYKSNMSMKGYAINIESISGDKYLISKKEVAKIIENHMGFALKDATIEDMDLRGLESLLNDDSRIESAELYLTKGNKMAVDIKQRKPIYRVNGGTKYPYYVDMMGERISVKRSLKKIRVPVVTGNVDPYHQKFKEVKNHNLKEVHYFFEQISNDDFMRALVEQLHIDENDQYIIIPKIGDKKIILGDMRDLKDKLKNLKTYYKQVGMDDFKVLDLRFKDQVVGQT